MKVSDYLAEALNRSGVSDAFGYPGALVCHLMDSIKKLGKIKLHLNYHEQACAFAVCGYGESSGKLSFAYANGGPGATNLVSGIADAYYDSIPAVFIIGQVDTTASVGELHIRQRGVQEIPVTEIVRPICKFASRVDRVEDIRFKVEQAIWEATSGRPGPAVLEIPADIQRAEVDVWSLCGFDPPLPEKNDMRRFAESIIKLLSASRHPCFIIGNGMRNATNRKNFFNFIEKYQIPCVFSLPAMDMLPFDHRQNLGFCGMNGHRFANFTLGKADLIVALGARMDLKLVGNTRTNFAPNATLVRVDLDQDELQYKVREDEIQIHGDVDALIGAMSKMERGLNRFYGEWCGSCNRMKKELYGHDFRESHRFIQNISQKMTGPCCITADVGQHEIHVAQAFETKKGQRLFLSLGLASMGFSLPAAIGAAAATGQTVLSFCGDGGVQMNIQELQVLARDKLPVKVIIFNNFALGMIREFQERNFQNVCTQSVESEGYVVPDFGKIANAYALPYFQVESIENLGCVDFNDGKPGIIEIRLHGNTYLEPRLVRDHPIEYMTPPLSAAEHQRYIDM